MEKNFFSQHIKIGDKAIGKNEPVFIVAEIGVNHNGDMELAKKMIETAAGCGADAVKFQTFRAENVMSDDNDLFIYQNNGKEVRENTYEMLHRLELPEKAHKTLFEHARACGITPFTTVTDEWSLKVAASAGSAAYKIASSGLTDMALLESLANQHKPVILSTGMTTEEELISAKNTLIQGNIKECVFLHCVSLYPVPPSEVNLARMESIRAIAGSLVGYSDHSEDIWACFEAAALGAVVLEKHFTLDKSLPGPDHAFSADPEDLQNLARAVRVCRQMLGSGQISPGIKEGEARERFRLSVTAARDLNAGSVINRDDLCLKRPGTGIHPSKIGELPGKRIIKAVKKDEQLQWKNIADCQEK